MSWAQAGMRFAPAMMTVSSTDSGGFHMAIAISVSRFKPVSLALFTAASLLAACGSENDEDTGVTAADVATCDRYESPVADDHDDCAEGKRAFDCSEDVDLAGKCDFAGEWASGGTNEPTRSGNTWCCAL
jgi:hypothetical protein